MTYQVNKATIELQCDNCVARRQISGVSMNECKRAARAIGWQLGTQDQNGRGKLRCPDCNDKR